MNLQQIDDVWLVRKRTSTGGVESLIFTLQWK